MNNRSVYITAGATRVYVDPVRYISNPFEGNTGTDIAMYFLQQGWNVILSTSSPDLVARRINLLPEVQELPHRQISGLLNQLFYLKAPLRVDSDVLPDYMGNLMIRPYETYQQLYAEMEAQIKGNHFDAVIHSSAVSDYESAGAYIMNPDGSFEKLDSSTKLSSEYERLFTEWTKTEKIIDHIRPWGFGGILCKFKLQTKITNEQLLDIAIPSMQHSNADILVANTKERQRVEAIIVENGPGAATYAYIGRQNLPEELYRRIAA